MVHSLSTWTRYHCGQRVSGMKYLTKNSLSVLIAIDVVQILLGNDADARLLLGRKNFALWCFL